MVHYAAYGTSALGLAPFGESHRDGFVDDCGGFILYSTVLERVYPDQSGHSRSVIFTPPALGCTKSAFANGKGAQAFRKD